MWRLDDSPQRARGSESEPGRSGGRRPPYRESDVEELSMRSRDRRPLDRELDVEELSRVGLI